MKQRRIFILLPLWLIWKLFSYYFIFPIFAFPVWIVIASVLLILTIIQADLFLHHPKTDSTFRIGKLCLFAALLLLSVWHSLTDTVIEKIDWRLFYQSRSAVVEDLKTFKELNGDRTLGLTNIFPPLSRGNNKIDISRHNNILSVKFWILEENNEVASPVFQYTNDPKRIRAIDELILKHPDENWQLEPNWYRTKY